MTILFVDGFDHWANTDYLKKWPSSASQPASMQTGRTGIGQAVRLQSSQVLNKTFANTAKLIVGFAFRPNSNTATNIFSFTDVATQQTNLTYNSNGTMSLQRNGATVVTTTAVIPVGAWTYIELKVDYSGGVGNTVYDLRFNNVSVLSGTAALQTTANNYANVIKFTHTGAAPGGDFDDLYLLDWSASPNNSFFGDVRIDTYYPIGDGTYHQWTTLGSPSDPNHYTQVDETTPNTTDYVYSGTLNAIDTFDFTNVGASTGTIYGIAANLTAQKSDAGARSMAAYVKSGATEQAGTSNSLSLSMLTYQQCYDTDPNTSAAWSSSGINAAEFGAQVSA